MIGKASTFPEVFSQIRRSQCLVRCKVFPWHWLHCLGWPTKKNWLHCLGCTAEKNCAHCKKMAPAAFAQHAEFHCTIHLHAAIEDANCNWDEQHAWRWTRIVCLPYFSCPPLEFWNEMSFVHVFHMEILCDSEKTWSFNIFSVVWIPIQNS